MPPAPLDVIYIAGAGRSGSTLIGRILGTCAGAWPIGEPEGIWMVINEESYRSTCCCGELIRHCPFWREVLERAFGPFEKIPVAHFRDLTNELKGHFFLKSFLPDNPSPRLHEYESVISRLYQAIAEVSGARTIIDASKNVAYGLAVGAAPGIRVSSLHLIRDSRAAAFSWLRPTATSGPQPMPFKSAAESAHGWRRENLAADALRFKTHRHVRVRYEDFARRPPATIDLACRRLGLETPDVMGEDSVDLGSSHVVRGNPGRFLTGHIAIREDDEWETHMDPRDAQTVTRVTWPLLLRHGYPLAFRPRAKP